MKARVNNLGSVLTRAEGKLVNGGVNATGNANNVHQGVRDCVPDPVSCPDWYWIVS
ncbi:MAG: hypothetical protein QM528_04555 [Phycisphaerales bacterium]|nr:hypothetical protein [Phycisphaerales bacterium]